MPVFTKSQDLIKKQQERLKRAQTEFQKAHEQAVEEAAGYALTLLHGTPLKRSLAQRKPPYQRLPRAFPIGFRSGTLARGMHIVYQNSGKQTSATIAFDAPYAVFVLSRSGTRRMAGTPFWDEVNAFYVPRARELASQAQQRANRS